MAEGSLEWWEQLCTSLEANPQRTTEVITAFEESPHSFDLSLQYITSPTLSPKAKFLALKVFQFSLLVKKWGVMSATEKMDITQMVWRMLSDDISLNVQDVSPSYMTGKFMQTFAAVMKRMWSESVESAFKLAVLTEMSGLFQNSDLLCNGAKLFKMVIQEFSFKSSVDQGLPIEFHRLSQTSFEAIGLDQSLELAFHSSTSLLSSILPQFQAGGAAANDPNLLPAIVALNECLSLYCEAISWYVQGDDIMASESERGNLSNAKISDSWIPFVRNEQFINDLVDVYVLIRNGSVGATLSCQDKLCDLFLSIRSILLLFVSAKQKFSTPDDELSFANVLLSKCFILLNASVSDIPDQFLNTADFRSQECDGFSNILNRLFFRLKYFQIVKLPEFQNSFLAISTCVVELCKELDMVSLYYLAQSKDDSETPKRIANSSKKLYNSVSFEEEDLLVNWRHSAISNCVEIFTHFTSIIEEEATSNNQKVSDETHLNSALVHVCPQIFIKLYETYSKLIVGDSMVHQDEEEEEEQEEIHHRNITDAIQKTCTVGRVCFVEACNFVTSVLTANLDAVLSETASGSSAELEKQEQLRVSLMFASNIIADPNVIDIPKYISVTFESNGKAAQDALTGLVGLIHRIGQEQVSAVSSNLNSPILSPLILSSVINFLEGIYNVYINCQDDVFFDDSIIAPLIENILQLVLLVVRFFPLQNDLVKNASDLLLAVSFLGTKDDIVSDTRSKLSQIIQLPIFSEIYGESMGQSSSNSSGFSRLNSGGIANLFLGLGSLIGNAENTEVFTQICSSIHKEFVKVAESPVDDMKPLFDQNLSCLAGLAKLNFSSEGQCKALLNETFDVCLPMICELLDAKFNQFDDIIQLFMNIVTDYSCKQIQTIPSKSSVILFQAGIHSMKTLSTRISRSSATGDEKTDDAEEAFKNHMIKILLQLLNFFSDRDNSLEDSESVNIESEKQLIIETLFFGLQCVVPWISVEILSSYPATALNYFMFLLYLNESYMNEFVSFLLQMEDQGFRLMEVLLEQLLWASGDIDLRVARMALKSIFSIGKLQLTSGVQVFPLQPTQTCGGYSLLFNKTLERLLSMLLFVEAGTLSVAIGSDRIDTAANALLVLISIDYTQFQANVQAIVASQSNDSVKDAILASFQRLVSSDTVNFANVGDSMTRRTFAKNLEEFTREIRPLLTYK